MIQNRSTNPAKFFSETEKEQILSAIRDAEHRTSGEVRLHLEKKAKKDVYDRALEVFHKIGMQKTKQRNGVLIYLATEEKQFAILGDKGINEVVPDNFWQDVVEEMQEKFRQSEFPEGLCLGIRRVGEKLKAFFPYQADDVNELSDEISLGEDETSKPDEKSNPNK